MMGGEIEFSEPIIHRIQSLLTGEEAARTTILSKSWHGAWLTRPNLDFDDGRFNARGKKEDYYAIGEFSKYAKKTIKRYEQSNLKIESLKLCMKVKCYAGADLANKLIVKALGNLGATRLILLLNSSFVIPREVVFGSDNLVELSVKNCKINLDGMVIKCCRLEFLSLDGVQTTRTTVSNIISSCPLIEKLSLSNIYYDDVHGDSDCDCDSESYSDSDSDSDSDYNDQHYGYGHEDERGPDAAGLMVDNLHRLRCLVLCYESFKVLFAGGLLSKFPFLKDLTLHLKLGFGFGLFDEEDIQISNCSLECIKLELDEDQSGKIWSAGRGRKLKFKLDVPSIRKFTFKGDIIPSLSFTSSSSSSSSSSSREWESHVSLKRKAGFTAIWFRELNEFLTQLRQSKIHLSLHVQYTASFDYKGGDVNIICKHELENLTIDMTDLPSLSCHALFDGLFRLCRPKLITQYKDEIPYRGRRKTNIDSLCQALEQGMLVKEWIRTQLMYGLNDLEEVNAQIFDTMNDDPEWRPIPLNSLLYEDNDVPTQRHRFLLKWKP